MKEKIYDAVGGVAAALIFMEMLLMLLPSGNMKKFSKVVAGIGLSALLLSSF